jgi:hypothetical protein
MQTRRISHLRPFSGHFGATQGIRYLFKVLNDEYGVLVYYLQHCCMTPISCQSSKKGDMDWALVWMDSQGDDRDERVGRIFSKDSVGQCAHSFCASC